MIEDFDLALEIIDSGVPDKDPDWLHMASTKLKAHKALKEGRNKDAIAHFREFMEIIKDDKKEESDPSTGLFHTTDMTLGFNERRIAEILLSDGDIKGAQTCCDAAEAHYEKAMSDMDGREKQIDFIKKCLRDINTLQGKIKAQSAAKTIAP